MLPGKKSNRNKFGIKRRRMFRRITYPKSPTIRFGEKFLLAFEIYVECLHNIIIGGTPKYIINISVQFPVT